MKKSLFTVLLILFTFLSLGGFLFLCYKVNEVNVSNKKLVNEIDEIKQKKSELEVENDDNEKKITNLKEEYKDVLEEVEIWEETKEKIQKVLS